MYLKIYYIRSFIYIRITFAIRSFTDKHFLVSYGYECELCSFNQSGDRPPPIPTGKSYQLDERNRKPRGDDVDKTMNGLTPEYLQRLFAQSYCNYNLRNSEGKLALPKPRTNYF